MEVRPFAEAGDDFVSVDDERLGRHLAKDNGPTFSPLAGIDRLSNHKDRDARRVRYNVWSGVAL
jgi:hypothetical protein